MSFLFKCPECGERLEAEDEWDGLESDCPFCGNNIKIAKMKLSLPGKSKAKAGKTMEATLCSDTESAAPQTPEKTPIPVVEMEDIYTFINDNVQGPFTRDYIIDQCAKGLLPADAKIQYEPDSWVNVKDVEWLQEVLPIQPDDSYDDSPVVSCPHCWHKFHLSRILYISKSPNMIGDSVLGESAQTRFVPSSFNEMGYAVDAGGYVCPEMACPRCHLKIPESFFNVPTNLFSVVGAPSSGKSYFLTAMVWMLRNILPKKFNCTLTDPDTTFNLVLNNYERTLYLNQERDSLVSLPKTELQGGDFSNQIMLDGISVDLPLPYIFGLVPTSANMIMKEQRNIIFYDNAGEHFEPGRDNISNPATQHLALSEGIIFIYDPIKDPRMTVSCDPNDPQVSRRLQGTSQIVLINEMISRIRKYTGMKSTDKYDKPLIVVMHKYDAWKSIFPIDLSGLDYSVYDENEMCWKVNMGNITLISYLMREILQDISPDIVAVTESFFKEVYFIPVSSLGHIPELDPEHDAISVRAGSLDPIWAEVPVLVQFANAGLVPMDNSVKQDGDVIEIKNFVYRNNSIIFTIPGTKEPFSVPQIYFGKVVFSAKASSFIRIPQPVSETMPKDNASRQESQGNPETDSFWQNE